MRQEPHRFIAPDGTEMVTLPAADYERLEMLAEEEADYVAALDQLKRIADGEGTVPGAVVDFMLDENLSAVAAWRKYRGLTQDELARAVGATQAWLSQIESGARHGRPKLRKALAKALDAPVWALEREY